jgi:hypothetical protein
VVGVRWIGTGGGEVRQGQGQEQGGIIWEMWRVRQGQCCTTQSASRGEPLLAPTACLRVLHCIKAVGDMFCAARSRAEQRSAA